MSQTLLGLGFAFNGFQAGRPPVVLKLEVNVKAVSEESGVRGQE
jgi:hypothetical protein